ncbi:MAG TPA: hypothetical protein VFL87_02480 [Thermoleophilaceae bacterium]|nr:hypothetical protein [Thermoleophilaceae bacterium]
MSTQPAKPLGARARGAAIAVPVLAFIVLVGAWLFGTHTHFAGSNTVAPRSSLAPLAPGHRLCVTGLTLPAHSNAVRFLLLSAPNEPATVTMRLSAGGRTQTARALIPFKEFGGTFRIAPAARDLPARACLTATKQVIAESGSVSANQGGEAFIDGKPIGQLTVVYLKLPPRRLISALPDGAQRASLFRAGFVGPWTYLVLALVLVAAWAAGLRLVFRSRA